MKSAYKWIVCHQRLQTESPPQRHHTPLQTFTHIHTKPLHVVNQTQVWIPKKCSLTTYVVEVEDLSRTNQIIKKSQHAKGTHNPFNIYNVREIRYSMGRNIRQETDWKSTYQNGLDVSQTVFYYFLYYKINVFITSTDELCKMRPGMWSN